MFRMTTCLLLLAGLLATGCGSLESSSTANGRGDSDSDSGRLPNAQDLWIMPSVYPNKKLRHKKFRAYNYTEKGISKVLP